MERKCDLQKSLRPHPNPARVALVDTHEEDPDLSKCVAGNMPVLSRMFQIAVRVLWCIQNLIEFLGSSVVSQWQDFDLKAE